MVVASTVSVVSFQAAATTKSVAAPNASSETQAVSTAASAFLNTLNAEQRQKVSFSFVPEKTASAAKFPHLMPNGLNGPGSPDGGPNGPPPGNPQPGKSETDKGPPGGPPNGGPGKGGGLPDFVGEKFGDAVWSNYPVSDVPRPGLQMGSLTSTQRAAAMHLLKVMLSPKGYQKVLDIMGGDQALADAGQHFSAGRDVYTIAILGKPSATSPWMVQFGGHHLGLNVVMDGQHGVMTPTLTGAQPAVYSSNGKTTRVLAGESDKAFTLLAALDDSQRKEAVLNYKVSDLVLGPGHDGETILPEGLKGSAMTPTQRALLLDLIKEWAGIVNDAYAKPRLAELQAGLQDTYFAWSGPTTHMPNRNGSSYYRIQGPKVIIEFSPQGVGGDPTMHVHTIYRDPTNDYGHAFTLP